MIGVGDQVASGAESFLEARREHTWKLPDRYNIAVDVVERWATDTSRSTEPALILQVPGGPVEVADWATVHRDVSRFGNALRERLRLTEGQTVAVILPQGYETAVAHMATYRIGAVLCPISRLYTGAGLAWRLTHSGARVVVTDTAGAAVLAELRDRCPALDHIVVVGEPQRKHEISFSDLVSDASPDCPAAPTGPNDPALLIYTSGTTGDPKGVLHGHRVALGHANFSYVLDIVRPGDSYYAPNDWSWIAGAGNGLLAPWGFGIPVLSMGDSRFEASDVTAFLDRHRPTLAFLPPSALRILRQAEASLDHKLRCLMSGGEVVTPELANWVTENLADSLNVGFGQTEGNDTIGTVHAWEEAPPGTIGQALPGHTVGVLDQNGNEVEVGEEGELALRYESNPTFMLGYFHNPAATAHAIRDGWIWTGDRVMRGDRGYLIFAGRADDVIKSSGYRIGPSEIERVLARHPAVLECAVVGLPDPERGEAITAVVCLRPGTSEERLREELTLAVRREVGHHAYPRRIEFVDELPKTVTGKVQRRALRAALLD